MMPAWSRRRLAAAGRGWLALTLALGVLTALTAMWNDPWATRLVTDFLILCVLVVALQVFVGNSGIVSFGHVAFFGVGAYTAALLTMRPSIKANALEALPAVLQQAQLGLAGGVLWGAVLAAALALLTGMALARMSEGAMAMATLALLVMLHTIFANWEAVTRGTVGVYGIPRNVTLVSAAAGASLALALAFAFKASRPGLELQATRDDPLAARSLGIDIPRVRLLGWVLSAGLMGAGGALWAQNNLAFGPNQFYYAETFSLLSMLVIGGLASVTGAIAGAAVVTLVSELLRHLENGLTIGGIIEIPELPGIAQLTVAVLIMVVLILRPAGLMGMAEFTLGGRRPRRTKESCRTS